MKPVKLELVQKNGTICMLCGEDVGKHIQWHHLIPRYAGGDDSYENASLLCCSCHLKVHDFMYGDEEYTIYTEKILANKK